MPDKFKIATVILAAVLVYDMRVARHYTKRHEADRKLAKSLVDQLSSSVKTVDYLSSLLDEHEVPVTEFDKIVLNNL